MADMPFAVALSHAIDDLGQTDDAAARKRERVRQSNIETALDLAEGYDIVALRGVDQNVAAIGCRPGAILNVFEPAYDQPGPRLLDAYDFEGLHCACSFLE